MNGWSAFILASAPSSTAGLLAASVEAPESSIKLLCLSSTGLAAIFLNVVEIALASNRALRLWSLLALSAGNDRLTVFGLNSVSSLAQLRLVRCGMMAFTP